MDYQTGRIIHDIWLFEPQKIQRKHGLNSFATPTPALENGFVYVHYGTYGTAGINSENGKIVWFRSDINCEHMQGPASSPILYTYLLILHLDGTDTQFITALDERTGKTVWTTHRPAELYKDVKPVYRKAYLTPIIIAVNSNDQLISNGARVCWPILSVCSGNELDADILATPAIVENALVFRTDSHLYRIEK